MQQGSTTTTRRSRNKECSSKYYGVRFRPDLSKWVAEIRVAQWKSVDKKVWLGTYISEEGAACAVDAARKILKCTKKKKPNFSCDRLEAYTESLPPELSLDNISDTTIFKAITEFVKCKAKQYASEITSGMGLPIVKEIRTTTFTPRVHMSNSQPAPAGDELTMSGTTVIQLAGSVNIRESLAKIVGVNTECIVKMVLSSYVLKCCPGLICKSDILSCCNVFMYVCMQSFHRSPSSPCHTWIMVSMPLRCKCQ